ncbi:metallophosphoesterase [uncultured Microscilla sp.]|uniref:metallophosphoesterase family protein n=1 Tax=uncultured Microscilla sp. TaxID=432653 RepID=UPI002626C4E9|nr:metallophosphoesterase [uncultured Microscilla sp.]
MKVAIFADLHGRLLLAFKLVERYQRETGQNIDLILQCGDVGIFPELDHLDTATLRFARRDRSELGFHDYFTIPHRKAQEVLEKTDCQMVCVRGNHEDHEFLDGLEQLNPDQTLFPVDCYKRVFVCKSGHIQQFTHEDATLNVLGVGRAGDRKNRDNATFIQPYERRQLRQTISAKPTIDILISHDVPTDMTDPGYGMKELRPALDALRPSYHFYGHTGKPFHQEPDNNQVTQSVKVAELEYKRQETLAYGAMLLLTVEVDQPLHLEVVEAPWLKEYTKSNWLYVD